MPHLILGSILVPPLSAPRLSLELSFLCQAQTFMSSSNIGIILSGMFKASTHSEEEEGTGYCFWPSSSSECRIQAAPIKSQVHSGQMQDEQTKKFLYSNYTSRSCQDFTTSKFFLHINLWLCDLTFWESHWWIIETKQIFTAMTVAASFDHNMCVNTHHMELF